MKRSTLWALCIAASALTVGAVLTAQRQGMTPEHAKGAPLLQGLQARADDISAIEVQRANATVRLERNAAGGWVVASNEGYPARAELVRALVVSAGSLTVDEPMTAKRARQGELGLAWPDASGRARRVRFVTSAPGAPAMADVILGEERFAPDSVFARHFDQEQTWRTMGRLQLPGSAAEWMDRTLLALPNGEVTQATLAGLMLDRPRNSTAQAGARPLAWDAAVDHAEADHWSTAQVASAQLGLPSFLERVEFEAVRRARPDVVAMPELSPSFQTQGAVVQVRGRREADGLWCSFEIEPKPNAPRPPAEVPADGDPFIPDYRALGDRLRGWEFRLPQWKLETLERMRVPDAIAPPPAG